MRATNYLRMNDNIRALLDISKSINSRTISVTRCLLLTLLAYFVDGLQYRELKTALRLSDGKLASNLNRLIAMGYVEKSVTKLERRSLSIYSLTPEGKKEIGKIGEWMNIIVKVVGEISCQI